MRHPLAASLALAFSLFLTACGDDNSTSSSGGGTPPVAATVSSAVVKGVIDGAVVTAWQWRDGNNVQLAQAPTNAVGDFALSLPAGTTGVIRLSLDLGDDGQALMRCDADAGCNGVLFGEWETITEAPGLMSWAEVAADGTVVVMPMTPLSTLVVRYAEALSGGGLDRFALSFARQRLALLLGMTADSLLARPGDVTSATWVSSTDASGLQVALLSAGFAEMAAGQGSSVNALIDDYVQSFLDNNGRLMQAADGAPSIGHLLAAARAVAQRLSSTDARTLVADWQARIDGLEAWALNTLPMVGFDSNAWLDAMGPLGADVRTVLADSGASSVEQLLFAELNQFGWLLSSDSLALVQATLGLVENVIAGMTQLELAVVFPIPADGVLLHDSEDYTVRLKPAAVEDGVALLPRLLVQGSRFGLDIDLVISLTALSKGSADKMFVFGAKGTLSNERVSAVIDGTLKIDPKDTDLNSLLGALAGLMSGSGDLSALKAVVAGILRDGHGVFTVEGAAGLTRLDNGSTLSAQGLAHIDVDMNGNAGGIKLGGAITHGALVLPNGDRFAIRSGTADKLTFAMVDDGSFTARFAATVLTVPEAVVTASGKLTDLGVLASHARDAILAELESEELDLARLLASLLDFDFGGMHLTVDGQAVVGAWGKTYRLSLNDGTLKILQPNSTTDIALQLVLGASGLQVSAGDRWMHIGLDWDNLALLIADQSGGEHRIEFGGRLLAAK
ncbi:MAG: hypothetical protein Q8J78_11435 [Moraxellaceae bacterium]|nr:hypothetical protein [Moraxellaceae bacterium]